MASQDESYSGANQWSWWGAGKFGKKKKDEWTDEEKRKDRKALSLIQLHLSNDILQEVMQEKTVEAVHA